MSCLHHISHKATLEVRLQHPGVSLGLFTHHCNRFGQRVNSTTQGLLSSPGCSTGVRLPYPGVTMSYSPTPTADSGRGEGFDTTRVRLPYPEATMGYSPAPTAGSDRGEGLDTQELIRPQTLVGSSPGASNTSSISEPAFLVICSSMSLPCRLPMATAVSKSLPGFAACNAPVPGETRDLNLGLQTGDLGLVVESIWHIMHK